MKALTLHQPWATLVAIGAKRVETRSWATRYRGPLAIHAGRRRPPYMTLPKLHSRGANRDEQAYWNRRTWTCIDTITDERYQGLQPTGRRIPKTAQTPTLFWPSEGPFGAGVWDPDTGEGGHTEHLPLGAIVAVAELLDVVRVEELGWTELWSGWAWQGPGGSCERFPHSSTDPAGGRHPVANVDQRPLGDFREGRYAWLLGEVVRLPNPVPTRGRQGLWTPSQQELANVYVERLDGALVAAGKPEGHR